MYQSPENYDKTAITAIQIYEDYGLGSFPLDPFELCAKMGIAVIPYSAMSEEIAGLSKKKTRDGYSFLYEKIKNVILYNDNPEDNNRCRIEFTILHEIKHIIDNDYIDDELHDDLSDYFAKYMKCPIPYLIVNNIIKVIDIMRIFNVNQSTAEMVSSNIKNRIAKYGHGIFGYEVSLLNTISEKQHTVFHYEIIGKSN